MVNYVNHVLLWWSVGILYSEKFSLNKRATLRPFPTSWLPYPIYKPPWQLRNKVAWQRLTKTNLVHSQDQGTGQYYEDLCGVLYMLQSNWKSAWDSHISPSLKPRLSISDFVGSRLQFSLLAMAVITVQLRIYEPLSVFCYWYPRCRIIIGQQYSVVGPVST